MHQAGEVEACIVLALARENSVCCTAVRVVLHRNKAFGIRSCNRGVCTELLAELCVQGEAACPP